MRNDKQIKMLPVHPYGKTLCRVHGGRRQDDWEKDALRDTQFKYGVPFRNRIIREKLASQCKEAGEQILEEVEK